MIKSVTLVLAIAACVFGHGGINGPAPLTSACSSDSSLSDCGDGTSPCGPGNANTNAAPVLTVDAGDSVNVGFFQRIAHAPSSGSNTYQIFWWSEGASTGTSLLSQNQVTLTDNTQLNFTVTVPSDASGEGLLQFVYNCTAGQASVYYTCSSIKVNENGSSAGSVVASVLLTAAAAVFAW